MLPLKNNKHRDMKKYGIYIGVLIVGILIGSFFWGGRDSMDHQHNDSKATVAERWTCSMHPHINLPEPGDCPICGMDLIIANTTDGDIASTHQFKMSKNAMALANIETIIISNEQQNGGGLVLSGTIKENEKNNAVQTSHFNGRIEKLYINSTGEEVKKGQLLALIYSPELVSTQGELLTALTMKASQPKLYKAVRNKLKLWKLSEKQILKIENSKKITENFPVYANVSGVVTHKMVEEGNHIKEGQTMFKIANLTTVWAEFDAYEKQLNKINLGSEISIITNADPNAKLKGKVSFIAPVVDSNTRTITIRVPLQNRKGNLKIGMFVKGNLKTTSANAVANTLISVPKTAVLWTGKRSLVYVKVNKDEPVFEMREVTLGNSIGEDYEIVSGLNVNDEIVVNGTFTVDAAAQLQGKKSMMNSANDQDIKKNKEVVKRLSVSDKFKGQLKGLFEAYLVLKQSLVEDKGNAAKNKALVVNKALKMVDMKLLADNDAHLQWMNYSNVIAKEIIIISNTESIEKQRKAFIKASDAVIKSIETFGIGVKVYKHFCPMAANNKGAFWASINKEVLNPYYGNQMLNCGSVVAEID